MDAFRSSRRKIFVIGNNKTGRTSMGAALQALGFSLGSQADAELLMEDWAKRDFRRIVDYCETADAFQDVPFSLEFTYQVLGYAFRDWRYILTVRNSSQEWYESLVRFHIRIVGKHRLPTADELKSVSYREMGWLWRTHELIYGIDESSVFDRQVYIQNYESRNRRILEYFRYRPDSLLVLNLSNPTAMASLCDFLAIPPGMRNIAMPHLNSSRDAPA